ncbi:unnamed protein product, partial [Ectocarpus sp. 13 AM-2016]
PSRPCPRIFSSCTCTPSSPCCGTSPPRSASSSTAETPRWKATSCSPETPPPRPSKTTPPWSTLRQDPPPSTPLRGTATEKMRAGRGSSRRPSGPRQRRPPCPRYTW